MRILIHGQVEEFSFCEKIALTGVSFCNKINRVRRPGRLAFLVVPFFLTPDRFLW